MELQTRILEDTLLVKIIGELDHHTAVDMRTQVDYLLNTNNNIKNIIFDLARMNFMDSSGVGMFMGRYKKIKEKEGIPVMINIQDSNRRLLKMSGLFNIYREYENLDDALGAIGERKNEK